MKLPSMKRLAPIGLYISLAAALVSGALYIVQRSFSLPLQISLACVVLGVAVFALLDPQRLREVLGGRQARYSSNILVLVLAFTGILIVLNYFVYKNPVRWDLTEDKQHTLSKETIETLKSIKDPVKVEAFFSSRTPSQPARDMLESYRYNSNGLLAYEFIDPEQDPVRAQAANVSRDGTIVLSQAGRSEQVSYVSEQDITSALIRLANPGKRAVYFLTGHGEYGPDETGTRSYSQVKASLIAKNYTVSTLSLLATRSIPEDALALIIAGPDKPVSAEELDIIKAYLEKGGSLVYLCEPTLVTQFGDSPDPLAPYLEQTWGIKLGDDMVIDLNYNPATVAVSASYGNHAITQKMGSMAIVLPSARSVTTSGAAQPEVAATILVQTATNSWAERDIASLKANKAAFDAASDVAGPVSLAIASVNSTTGARVVVVGDSDFASTNNFTQYGNGDFLINVIGPRSRKT
jgi:ABC-type uncharacterized transport system involved in gliding motility auxiliary subunit